MPKMDFTTFLAASAVVSLALAAFLMWYSGIDFGHQTPGSNSSKFAGIVMLIIAAPIWLVINTLAYFVWFKWR